MALNQWDKFKKIPTLDKQQTLAAQTTTAYQQNVSQPVKTKDDTSTRATMAKLFQVTQSDPVEGSRMQNEFAALQADKTSKYYNPYTKATNQAVGNLNSLGVDTSQDGWYDSYSWLKNYYHLSGTTNNATSPGTKASKEEQAAYQYAQYTSAMPNTEKAKQESAALREELSYWATNTTRNLSDDEIIARVDWSKYPTLQNMIKTAATGQPMELNEPVDMATDDWMYGVIWQARNDDSGTIWNAMANSYLGNGNVWQDNAEISAKLDRNNSDTYAPCSVGSTLDDEGVYFGKTSFTKEDVEEIKRNLNWNDATAVKMFNGLNTAEKFTESAESEVEEMNKWLNKKLESATKADDLLNKFEEKRDEDWKHLSKIDESTADRNPVGTTRAIDYDYNEVKKLIETKCAENAAKTDDYDTAQEMGVTLGTEQDHEVAKGQENTIRDAGEQIEDIATDAERKVFNVAPTLLSGAFQAALTQTVVNPWDLLKKGEDAVAAKFVSDSIGAYGDAKIESDAKTALNAMAFDREVLGVRMRAIEDAGASPDEYANLYDFKHSDRWDLFVDEYVLDQNGNENGVLMHPGAAAKNEVTNEKLQRAYLQLYQIATGDYGMSDADIIRERGEKLWELVKGDMYAISAEDVDKYEKTVKESERQQQIADQYKGATKIYNDKMDSIASRISLLKMAGLDTRGLETSYAVAATMPMFANYEATVWSDYNKYDLMERSMEEGDSFEDVMQRAAAGSEQVQDELEYCKRMKQYIQETGVSVPDGYMNNLDRHIAMLERDQTDYDYFALRGNADFQSAANAGRILEEEEKIPTESRANRQYQKDHYEDWDHRTEGRYVRVAYGLDQANFFDQMEPEEVDTFYYLYATQGFDAAAEYYNYLTDPEYGVLHTRNRRDIEEQAANEVNSGFWQGAWANAKAILSAPLDAATSALYFGYTALTGNEFNPNNATRSTSQYSTAVNAETRQAINDTYGEDTVLGQLAMGAYEIAYNRGRSFTNMMAFGGLAKGLTAGLGKLASYASAKLGQILGSSAVEEIIGALPMAIDAAGTAASNVKDRGGSDTQAYAIAGITAFAESFTEGLTYGNMKEALFGGDELAARTARELLANWVTSSGVEEMIGETLNDVIENLGDDLVMGALSEHDALVRSYISEMGLNADNPVDWQKAEEMAFSDEMGALLHTAIISYLSPGLDVVAGTIKDRVQDIHNVRSYVKSEQKRGNTEASIFSKEVWQEYDAYKQAAIEEQRNRARNPEPEQAPAEQAEAEAPAEEQAAAPEQAQAQATPAAATPENISPVDQAFLSDLAALEAVAKASPSTQTDAIGALFSTEQGTINGDRANAAAAALTSMFDSVQEAVQTVHDIIDGARRGGFELVKVKQALQTAALSASSLANEFMSHESFWHMTPVEQAQMLSDTVEEDATNETVQQEEEKAVREDRVARKEAEIIAERNGLEVVRKAKEALDTAQNNLRMARESLDEKISEAAAKAEALNAATNEMVQNPTDENAKNVDRARNEYEGAMTSADQYEQHLDSISRAEQKARADFEATRDAAMKDVRLEATERVAQEDQQRADEELARQEEANRIAEEQAQAQAEEDQRTGKADEDEENAKIDRFVDSSSADEMTKEKVRAQLKDRNLKRKEGKVNLKGRLTDAESMLALYALQRKLNIPIAFSDTLGDADGKYENGVIYLNNRKAADGSMKLGQALVQVALHEITHGLEATKSYQNYRNIVIGTLFGFGDNFDADAYALQLRQKIDQYRRNGVNLTEEGAEKEIVADFAKKNLSDKEVVQRFMDAGMGGRMRNLLHNINQAFKNFFGRMTGEERQTAENLRKAERAFQKALVERANTAVHTTADQFSVAQFAQATGMKYDEATQTLYDTLGRKVDGVNNKVTRGMITQTPVGRLITTGLSTDLCYDKDGNVRLDEEGQPMTKQTAALDMFAGLMNMIAMLKDQNMVWEIAGSTLESTFSALKSNSDTQYHDTIDFGTICAKTQAIVNVMSEVMMDRLKANKIAREQGRTEDISYGLTREDVLKIYNETHKAGLSVPCPVCYVFSRWMGVPSLLGQMSRFQHDYVVTGRNEDGSLQMYGDVDPVMDENGYATFDLAETQKKVTEYVQEMLRRYKDKDGIDDRKSDIVKEIDKRENNHVKIASEIERLEGLLKDPTLKKRSRDAAEKNLAAKRIEIEENAKATTALDNELREVEAYNWITQSLLKQETVTENGKKTTINPMENGLYVVDKNFRLTPDEILMDLRRTGEFADRYAKNWGYRTSRGAGMGKSILPYSGMSLGDVLLGDKTRVTVQENALFGDDAKNIKKVIDDAIERAKRQNLIGGQRLQSTSDFRPEWGLDYIMAFLELQAAKSNAQMYTKVLEAVDLFASMGADVNLSIMGRGNGYHEATPEEIEQAKTDQTLAAKMGTVNGKTYVLDFSDVTGIQYDDTDEQDGARTKTKQYDNVQMILVGMNDMHIRLAMMNDDIDFIIPWHSSGNSKDVLSQLVASVQESLETSSDYSSVQSDKFVSRKEKYVGEDGKKHTKTVDNRTDAQKTLWNARIKIITGIAENAVNEAEPQKGGLTQEEYEAMKGNSYLSELYERFYKRENDKCYHVALTASQAKQIFPYEYWQTDVTKPGGTKDTADENGLRFIEYCQAMGVVPRFSGTWDAKNKTEKGGNFAGAVYDENGNIIRYDPSKMDKGYWKLLIDRRMYDRNGNYRDQQTIDVSNVNIGGVENGQISDSSMLPKKTSAKYGLPKLEQQAARASESLISKPFDLEMNGAQMLFNDDFTDAELDDMLRQAGIDLNYELEQMSPDEFAELADLDLDEEESRIVLNNAVEDIKDEFDPTIYNGKLYVKPETMDHWLSSSGFASMDPDYAQAYITKMNPADFLRMTTASAENQQRILNETKPLNQDGNSLDTDARNQPIMLYIDEANGKIVGHEGRHRSIALSRAGVNEIPVLLYERETRYGGKTPHAEMTFTGQSQIEGADNGNTYTFTNVVPLNNTYRDELYNEFTASEAERTAAEEQGQQILQYSMPSQGDYTDAELDDMLRQAGVLNEAQYSMSEYEGAPLEGENPPATSAAPGPQRQFGSQTAQDSDEIDAFVRQYLNDNSGYIPDTNEAQIERAVRWLRSIRQTPNSDGLYEAIQKITANDFDYRSADGQARMVAAMGLAVAHNDVMAQVSLADAFNRQGTDLGRALQSRKLFRLMTPEGRIGTLQRMLQNTQNELNAQGTNLNLKFSEWIYRAAAAATEEGDFQLVQQAAANELAEQIPANWKDRIRSLRMLAMLANPRTHIRNVLGNALFIPAVGLKNKLGAIGEIISGQDERTKTLAPILNKEVREFARQDAKTMKDTLTGEAKYNEDSMVQRAQKPFKGLLQAMIDFNSNALEAEDWLFLKGHYVRALGSWMQANGYTAAQLQNDSALLEKGRAYAVEEAQKATYRDFNKLAQTLNKVSREGGVGGFLVDAVLPFKKTPANILKRGMEYSPAGIMRSLTTDLYHLKQWNDYQSGKLNALPEKAISPTQFIDRLCSGLTGTAIAAVGMLLGSAGIIGCGLDDDDDKFDKAKGDQEYSFKFTIGGKDYTFTIDWAAPMSMPFFVGAAIQEQLANEGNFDVEAMVNAFANITEPVFNLSMLDGVNTLFKTSQNDDTNTLTQIGAKVVSNYITSYVPSILGATARTFFDDTRRKAYVESGKGTGVMGTFRYAWEQTENKLPGVSKTNIPYRDIWGQEETSGFIERLLENFILPGYIQEYKNDPILNEMERLYMVTGEKDMIPKEDPAKSVSYNNEKYVLTAEQWDTYKATRNQTAYNMLSEMIDSDEYKNASDSTKAEMIKTAWSYADKVGKSTFIPDLATGDMGPSSITSIATDAKITEYKNEMIKALNAGDQEAYETMVEALEEAGVEDSEIKTKIGNTYRDKYKEAYRKGDTAKMAEIEDILDSTDFDFNYDGKGGWQDQVDEKYGK